VISKMEAVKSTLHNPGEAGFLNEPYKWRLSSANPNFEIKLSAL
jgi:hypothetical protein